MLGRWIVSVALLVLAGSTAALARPLEPSTTALQADSIRPVDAAAASSEGLWLVDRSGRIEARQGAENLGDLADIELNRPIVGIAPTPTGKGYWLAASDGGVFTFGDATFWGSLGDIELNRPIVDIAPTPTGTGYWLAASDGGVFTFGDATFHGAEPDGDRVVALATWPGVDGYWVLESDGDIRSAGDAAPLASVEVEGAVALVPLRSDEALVVDAGAATLPWGTTKWFEGTRLIGHYGSPASPLLGLLGETGPDEAARRIQARLDEWDDDGVEAIGTMEIITTIATSAPGADGDYSSELPIDTIRPWVDTAAAEGLYVLLDLQPGRSSFAAQAPLYEELLALPHVGLALDPEWRMGPDERPGRTLGSVDAAEINEVSAWLADLVEREGLPDKLLVLHQFNPDMIQRRHLVEQRPGLEIMIHADGFGTVAQKLGSYARNRIGPPFWNGFKLFLDEDERLMTPAEVLALDPAPVLITYQ